MLKITKTGFYSLYNKYTFGNTNRGMQPDPTAILGLIILFVRKFLTQGQL